MDATQRCCLTQPITLGDESIEYLPIRWSSRIVSA